MKIVFLGTSAGWPLPRLGCNCEVCKSKDLKDKRLRPSALIDDHLLIDAGLDIYHELIRYSKLSGWKLSQLTDVVITHPHFDHISGIWDLSKIYKRPRANARDFLPLCTPPSAEFIDSASSPAMVGDLRSWNSGPKINLWCPKSTLAVIRDLLGVHLTSITQKAVSDGEIFNISGNLKLTYFEVIHSRQLAYGIKVKGNKLLAYASDFRQIGDRSTKIIKGVDLAVFDGSSFNNIGQAKDHQNILEGIGFSKKLGIKKTYFTHIGHKTGKHEVVNNFLIKNFGNKYQLAFDGLELNL